ncbi:MAG: TRAP transporter large permease subunit [Deltaproteobacteria bacterium]|nr:TRAP transporter large permease subunit [Deltaproteobacteria bacterium]
MFLINIFLLIVGMFMEGGAAIIILAPILAQVVKAVGIHPLHFGLVMVFNLVIGELTPPLGVVLFEVCSIARIQLIQLIKALFPFLMAELAVLFLLTYFPWLTLCIPRLLGYA